MAKRSKRMMLTLDEDLYLTLKELDDCGLKPSRLVLKIIESAVPAIASCLDDLKRKKHEKGGTPC